MMKRLAIATAIILAASPAAARQLLLNNSFVQQDGAILSYPDNAALIDPYFPTKALMLASDNGMNVDGLAENWINWLITRQESDGLFSRFCYNNEASSHKACMAADADDAMMAMWIEMLYRHADDKMPGAWSESAKKALTQLDALFDETTGVYFISKAMPVGLLMDNIEIYSALKRAGKEAYRVGERNQSQEFYLRAYKLKAGVIRTFWNPETKRFLASTQQRPEEGFYPDDVAQLIPSLHGFYSYVNAPSNSYASWMQAHKKAWFDLIGKQYPWGLVAVAAVEHNDMKTAACWIKHVAPHRQANSWWNIVDEAAFQAVALKLEKAGTGDVMCEGMAS